jgi:hypothetical protein
METGAGAGGGSAGPTSVLLVLGGSRRQERDAAMAGSGVARPGERRGTGVPRHRQDGSGGEEERRRGRQYGAGRGLVMAGAGESVAGAPVAVFVAGLTRGGARGAVADVAGAAAVGRGRHRGHGHAALEGRSHEQDEGEKAAQGDGHGNPTGLSHGAGTTL